MSSASLQTTLQHMLDTQKEQGEQIKQLLISTSFVPQRRGVGNWPARECDREPDSLWVRKKYERARKHQEARGLDAAVSTKADSAKRLQHPTTKTSPVGVQAASATSTRPDKPRLPDASYAVTTATRNESVVVATIFKGTRKRAMTVVPTTASTIVLAPTQTRRGRKTLSHVADPARSPRKPKRPKSGKIKKKALFWPGDLALKKMWAHWQTHMGMI